MSADTVPQQVLAEAITEALGDFPVRAALFLTFQLQPVFFEEEILAPILGVESRGSAPIRRAILEERLRELSEVLVVYDHNGLVADGPLRQRVRAQAVHWQSGLLHAKHALLLQDDVLLLLTTSANLTRGGWAQNVEVADIERISKDSPLRDDLMTLLNRIEGLLGEPSVAVTQIRGFLGTVTQSAGLPRLWLGEESLPDFLKAHLPTRPERLELIAPFVDQAGLPVIQMHKKLQPKELIVALPLDNTEKVAASDAWLDGVRALSGARLGTLSSDRSLGARAERQRYVHAKIIRATDGRDTWVLAGSPNLSIPGHAGAWSGAGWSNIETAILRREPGSTRWLKPLESDGQITAPAKSTAEAGSDLGSTLPVRVRYDWATGAAEACTDRSRHIKLGPGAQGEGAWVVLLEVSLDVAWSPIPAEPIATALERGNVLTVWAGNGPPRPFLVEELSLAQRPSHIVGELTAADILQHWSLLSHQQRAAHAEHTLERLSAGGGDDELLPPSGSTSAGPRPHTMFDALAGVLHAFRVLRRRLREARERDQLVVVETLVLGRQHDSLPVLIEKIAQGDDQTRHLVVLLCARDLVAELADAHPTLWVKQQKAVARLMALLNQEEELWASLEIEEDFRDWFTALWCGLPQGDE